MCKIKSHLNIRVLFIVLLIMATTLLTSIPYAYADDGIKPDPDTPTLDVWETKREEIRDTTGDVAAFAWEVGTTALGANPNFSLTTIGATIYRFSSYSGKWAMDSPGTSIISAGASMYNAMSIVGIALIFLYFLIELLDEVQADSFTVEHLIKKLITLAIAILVLSQGDQIFTLIAELGDSLIDNAVEVSSTGVLNSDTVTSLYNTLINAGQEDGLFSAIKAFFICFGIILENILGYLLYLVVLLVAYLISFSRFIEFIVRFAFAPIGVAQLVSGGAKGPGMRYIKKFAACVLQGAVCVMALGACLVIQNFANEVNSFFTQFLLPITVIGFLMKTQRIAEDIVGV